MRAWIITTLLALLLSTQVTATQQETYRATGLIVDTDGKPVAGAEVLLYSGRMDANGGWLYSGGRNGLWDYEPRLEGRQTTEANGRFDFRMAVARELERFCYVAARKAGYATQWVRWHLAADLCVDMELGKPQRLAGYIRDANDLHPVAGAHVSLDVVSLPRIHRMGHVPQLTTLWFATRTDSTGAFAFADLPPDASYEVRVDAPGYCRYRSESRIKGLGLTGGSAGPDALSTLVELEPAGQVSGTVVNKTDGTPVAGIQVRTENYEIATTDAEGRFLITQVSAGPHQLGLEPPGRRPQEWMADVAEVTVRAGYTSKGIKIEAGQLDPNEQAWLEVVVTDDAQRPVHDARVLSDVLDMYTTDVNGIARIALKRGRNEFRLPLITKVGYWNTGSRQTVHVAPGQTVRREFELTPAPRVEGVVVNTTFEPVKGVQIASAGIGYSYNFFTGPDGRFAFFYGFVDKPAEPICYDLLAIDVKGNRAALHEVDVPGDDIVIRLKPAVEVVAHIMGRDGMPLAGASGRMSVEYEGKTVSVGLTFVDTDRNGRLVLRGIAPGFMCRLDIRANGYQRRELEFKSPDDTGKPYDLGRIELEAESE